MNDVPNNPPTVLDGDLAVADAILDQWKDAGQLPSEAGGYQDVGNLSGVETVTQEDPTTPDDENVDVVDDEELEDPEEELEQDEDEDEEEESAIADDDDLVEIKVGEEQHQVSVKDLKRLYGQEKSLTQKSQELSSQRKQADEVLQRSSVVLDKMLQRAQERFKPFAEVDMLLASKTMTDEEFAQLRQEYATAEADLRFLQEEADAHFRSIQDERQTQIRDAARECVRVLRDDIPEWDDSLYAEIRHYAVSQGLQESEVNQYVDPAVIKILNKARLFDQGKQVATTKRKSAKKKVLRSQKTPQQAPKPTNEEVSQRLRGAGNLDEMAEAIMSGWKGHE